MSEIARRGRPGHDQAAVLRTAIALFNRQGYDATSVGDLARELGVSKSAIYHHVSGKEQLLEQALDEALDGLTAALDEADAAGGSAEQRLRGAIRGSVEVLIERLPAVTLLLRVRGNSPIERAALDRRREIDDRLAAVVSAAVTDGSLRSDIPPDLISKLLFGLVNSLVEWVRPDGRYGVDLLSESITELAFDGLARR